MQQTKETVSVSLEKIYKIDNIVQKHVGYLAHIHMPGPYNPWIIHHNQFSIAYIIMHSSAIITR
jgi:hypothetical protein